jgi:limonene-1,2-epoxide hydrolase
MGQVQEVFIREFLDAWGDGTSESRPDVEKILSMMSPDAVWQLWVPGGPNIRGREALREEIHRQMGFATNNKCNIVNVISTDRIVMTERADDVIMYGRPCPHHLVAVYELDDQGLIKAWREYIDMADLTQKMGVEVAAESAEAGIQSRPA